MMKLLIIDKEQIKKNLQDNGFRRMFEQEFAWSEEDNEHLERILKELENQRQRPINNPYLDKIESDYNWLKSLKDRVQPQQEWGEEDDELYNDLSDTYFYNDEDYPEETYKLMLKRVLDWMTKRAKSLRPQSQWKPSDEQMTQLKRYCPDNRPLTSLYEQLKKLKD